MQKMILIHMLGLDRRNRGEKGKTKQGKKIIGNLAQSQKLPKIILRGEIIKNGEK